MVVLDDNRSAMLLTDKHIGLHIELVSCICKTYSNGLGLHHLLGFGDRLIRKVMKHLKPV